ncbi:MAG: hypothetical protein WCI56_00800 [Hyphomicrobiales bacterium]
MTLDEGIERFIFTVATGRCGQASLTQLVQNHVPGCYPAFEEPQVRSILPRPFDTYERLFRRRFVETHELLGRGKVLRAFESDDHDYIDAIVARRLRFTRNAMMQRRATLYFDISKFFARGLHVGFLKAAKRYALVNLVRDPIQNMRSFLNRDKRFTLDNSLPEARSNILRISSPDLAPGEFYLWSWCELNLRYERMSQSNAVTHAIEILTEHLEDAQRMNAAFDALGLVHSPVVPLLPDNTNLEKGLPATTATEADIKLFECFLDRIPTQLRDRIPYLKGYDPWAIHEFRNAKERAPARAQ